MGRPIQLAAAVLLNALTASTGVTASGATPSVATASITLPTKLGGGASTQTRVTAGAAATNMFTIMAMSIDVVGKKGIEFWVHVSGLENASNPSVGGTGTVSLRSAGATATLTAIISYKQGWNHIRLGREDFATAAGGATWNGTTFVDVTVKWDGIAGVTPVLHFANLSYSGYSRPQFSIVFDDGYDTVYNTALPIMSAYKIPGTVGVISTLVGGSGKMTLPNLVTLHDTYDWAMCNHTATHGASPFLQSANQAACYAEIWPCKAYLEAQGWIRDGENLDFIAPYGEWSAAYNDARVMAGCRSFWGLGSSDYASAPSKPSFGDRGVEEPYLSRLSLIQGATTAQVTGVLDRAISSGRSLSILFHSIVAVPSINLEIATATLQGVCEYLHRKRGMIDIVTLPQMYNALVDPTA